MKRVDGGYTIVEVSMALAFSASLIILTVGLVGMVNRQRFKDSLVSLEVYLRQEYDDMRSDIAPTGNAKSRLKACSDLGVSTSRSPSSTVGACYVVGRTIEFGAASATNSHDPSSLIRSSQLIAYADKKWPAFNEGLLNLGIKQSGDQYKFDLGDSLSRTGLHYIAQLGSILPSSDLRIDDVSDSLDMFYCRRNDSCVKLKNKTITIMKNPADQSIVVSLGLVPREAGSSGGSGRDVSLSYLSTNSSGNTVGTSNSFSGADSSVLYDLFRPQKTSSVAAPSVVPKMSVVDTISQSGVRPSLIATASASASTSSFVEPKAQTYINISSSDIVLLRLRGNWEGVVCVRGTDNSVVKTNSGTNIGDDIVYETALNVCGME